MARIFVSHAHRDRVLATRISRELEKLGFDILDSTSISFTGGTFRDTIRSAIKRTDILVLILGSPDAAATSWLTYGVGMAEALGKPVVVLASHDFPLRDLPSDIADYQVQSFDPMSPEPTIRSLAERFQAAS